VGFSTSGPSQAEIIRAGLTLPETPFSVVQSTWNLFEQTAGPALADAHDANWLVVIKEVLANGRLTLRGGDASTRALAVEGGRPLAQLAVGAALGQPWADIVLSGAVIRDQLRENVRATPLAVSNATLATVSEDPERYWAARSIRGWN
jgi:aryl-alcohol dehydrogenase-like predicted oxidoreductase